jgi:hypothetical protein
VHRHREATLRETKKSRHNRTPAVFDCIGLLSNGSAGRRPIYPLFSRPKTLLFCQEPSHSMLQQKRHHILHQSRRKAIGKNFGVAKHAWTNFEPCIFENKSNGGEHLSITTIFELELGRPISTDYELGFAGNDRLLLSLSSSPLECAMNLL